MSKFCGRRVLCGVARKIFGSMKSGYIGYIRSIRIAGMAATVLFAMMMIAAFFPVVRKTDKADAIATAATSSINITSVSNIANVDILLDDEDGTFAASNSDIAFDVTTNNLTGYSLMIADNGTAGRLINTDYGDVIDTLAAITPAETFETGAAEDYSNRWGFKPNKYNSLNNVDYVPAPSTNLGSTLNVTDCANGTGACPEKDSYTIGVGARVGYEKSEGVYSNAYTLVALANLISYEINFLDNTSDTTVNGLPDTEPGTNTSIAEYTLPTDTPTRTGYDFAGWCLGPDTNITNVPFGNSVCSSTVYAPGDTYKDFNNPANLSNVIDFYALWNVKSYNITIKAGTGISSVTLNGVYCDDKTSGCPVYNLVFGHSYNLEVVMDTGYIFSGWNTGAYGTVADATSQTTQYIVGAGDSTIVPTTTADGYTITIKTGTGISKVTLNGVNCGKESGSCSVTGLLNGVDYDLIAVAEDGYTFSNWSGGAPGTIASTSTATTKYTVGGGTSTITANATANKYSLTVTFSGNATGVTVKSDSCGGTAIKTATTSDSTVTGLSYGVTYYLCSPTFSTGYGFSSWARTDTISGAAIGSTTTVDSSYKVGVGNGAITITGKALTYTVNLSASNANNSYTNKTTATYGSSSLAALTTLPTRANGSVSRTVSFSRGTNASDATISSTTAKTSTATVTYTFTGWYKESAATTKVASDAKTPALSASVSGLTNASSQWIATTTQTLYAGWSNNIGTYSAVTLPTISKPGYDCSWNTKSDGTGTKYTTSYTPGSSTVTLYGYCAVHTYTVNLSASNANNSYTNKTTVAYGSKTLAAIATLPTRANGSKTITISFGRGTNASDANISSTTAKSTATVTYTFNGWHKSSDTGTLVASNAKTPALSASVSGFTNASSQWIATSNQTLYAGWSDKAGDYSKITLPEITKNGYTCGWATSSGASTYTYASKGSYAPDTARTLYGICKANTYSVKFNGNGGANSSGTTTKTQTGFTYGAKKVLDDNIFYRANYYFDGWSKTASGSTAYQNKAEVSNLTATNGATVNLYAVWKPIYLCDPLGSAGHYVTAKVACYTQYGEHVPGTAPTFRTWILGNDGKKIKWTDAFKDPATYDGNANTATIKKSGLCPAGFSATTIGQYDEALRGLNTTGTIESPAVTYAVKYTTDYRTGMKVTNSNVISALKNALGVSHLEANSSGNYGFWARSKYKDGTHAFRLYFSGNSSVTTGSVNSDSVSWYVLCNRSIDG